MLHRSASAVCLLAASSLKGAYCKAVAADTLDLAERARLAVNAITGAADPHNNYEVFQCGHCDQQPSRNAQCRLHVAEQAASIPTGGFSTNAQN